MNIPTATIDSIADDFKAAITWMESLGIKFSNGRLKHYTKVINYWTSSYKNLSDEEVKSELPDFVSSIYEIFDFINIHKALKNESNDKLDNIIEKLNKGVSGPVNASDETPKSTMARNFIFEALMAARSHKPHIGVSAILDASSDTGILIDNKRIWIECKRITSLSKIESNIKKASKQLEKTLNKKIGTGHLGFVAIDVTKIINPNNDLYVQENSQTLKDSIDRMMAQFINEYSNQWEKVYARRNNKIIGTIIRFSFIAILESNNLLVHTSQWAVNPCNTISASKMDLLESLVNTVNTN